MSLVHGNTHAPDATNEAITKLGRKAFAVTGDLSDRATPQTLIEQTINHFGRLDILVKQRRDDSSRSRDDYAEERLGDRHRSKSFQRF